MDGQTKLEQVLHPYQKKIEDAIAENITSLGPKSKLRDACEYALLNGGKRFRPAIVLMVARALNKQYDATHAALAIEYFHTASLVVDDLPSMDDDDERRNKPSVHKLFGEAAALLVSYALIAAGYGAIAKNTSQIGLDHVGILALENSTYNTGLYGATGGQFIDLFPPDLSLDTLRDVIHKKTVSLFEIAFVFGWLFGGGASEQLDLVKKAASHFGTAFQVADDIGDIEQDLANKRFVNVAVTFGKERALQVVQEEVRGFLTVSKLIGLDNEEFRTLIENL